MLVSLCPPHICCFHRHRRKQIKIRKDPVKSKRPDLPGTMLAAGDHVSTSATSKFLAAVAPKSSVELQSGTCRALCVLGAAVLRLVLVVAAGRRVAVPCSDVGRVV